MRCVLLISVTLLTLCPPCLGQGISVEARGRMIGVNTGITPEPYAASYCYTNAAHHGAPWHVDGKGYWPLDSMGGLILDAGEDVVTRIYFGRTDFPLGTYVVTFDGDGDFTFPQNRQVFRAPRGRFELPITQVSPNGGIEIHCTRSNPTNRVRNFAVWSPGYERSRQTFRREHLQTLSGFRVLRTMQDQKIINGPGTTWANRPKLTDQWWTGPAGVPLEALCELSNASGADLWLCVHHLADDDYVRRMAQLVRNNLSLSRRVYLELDCEVWNWGFQVATWQKDKYAPPGVSNPNDCNFYGQTDWYPYRARQIFRIWEQEWAGLSRSRLSTVIAGQSVWPDRGRFLLRRARAFNGGKAPCDAYAIAPYFYPSSQLVKDDGSLRNPSTTLDELFADLLPQATTYTTEQVRANAQVASEFGVGLVCYEAGQHLATSSDPGASTELFIAANRDERMGQLYKPYIDAVFNGGATLIPLYTEQGLPGVWGSWGLRETGSRTVNDSPKLRAVRQYMMASSPTGPLGQFVLPLFDADW